MRTATIWALLMAAGVLFGAPAPAGATDGDTFDGSKTTKGDWRIVASTTICDGKTAALLTCTQLDLGSHSVGITDRLVFAKRQETGCTANPTLTVTTSDLAAATYDYAMGAAGAALTVNDATPRVTYMVDEGAMPGRYLNFTITDAANCTDLDFVMHWVTEAGDY